MNAFLKGSAFLVLSLLVVLGSVNAGATLLPGKYLVAFSAENDSGMPRYLLEMNSLGRIVRGPRKITEPVGEGFGTLALFQNERSNPHIWLQHRSPFLYVLEIDPVSWSVVSRKKTSMTPYGYVDVGHTNGSGMLLTTANGTAVGYPLSPRGLPAGEPKQLAPPSSSVYRFFAGVSADGRVLLSSTGEGNLLFRSLNSFGTPTGRERRVASTKSYLIKAADISGPLPKNVRLLAFIDSGASFAGSDNLYLRSVPADGQPLGDEILLDTITYDDSHPWSHISDVAIDPNGTFVLYTKGRSLVFQALGADGKPMRPPVAIVSSEDDFGLLELDILKQ